MTLSSDGGSSPRQGALNGVGIVAGRRRVFGQSAVLLELLLLELLLLELLLLLKMRR